MATSLTDPTAVTLLSPGELAAALHLSGAPLTPTMRPTRSELTALVELGIARAGRPAIRDLAVTTAALDEVDTPAAETALRRLWGGIRRDEACSQFGYALAGIGPYAPTLAAHQTGRAVSA
jgi:hypothetical protein